MATEQTCLRALAKGGMAVFRDGGYIVFRTDDARRGVVGTLSHSVFEGMRRDGLVQLKGDRFFWVNGASVDRGMEGHLSIPVSGSSYNRHRTLLEKALSLCATAEESLRLAHAARCFSLDLAAAEQGPTITMNWEFVPRGASGRSASVPAGQSFEAVSARRRISILKEELNSSRFDMLLLWLAGRASQRRLAADFGQTMRRLPELAYLNLIGLADSYDLHVPKC